MTTTTTPSRRVVATFTACALVCGCMNLDGYYRKGDSAVSSGGAAFGGAGDNSGVGGAAGTATNLSGGTTAGGGPTSGGQTVAEGGTAGSSSVAFGGAAIGGVASITGGQSATGGATIGSTGTTTTCPSGDKALLVGDWRLCSEGGLYGPCASGQQSCIADGTFSACTIQPKASDTCDQGNDDDCDGTPNEGCGCINGGAQACGDTVVRGICHQGVSRCSNGSWGECQGAVYPKARDCSSGNDNDCDGVPDNTIDSACKCGTSGISLTCGTHPGYDGKGICKAGTQPCIASIAGSSSDLGDCTGSVGPGTELCDGATDEDCDGFIDEGCPCPGTAGSAMVRLPEGYCIDSTEVTRDQYAAWLITTTAATISGQDGTNCGSNTTFIPDATCMANTISVCQGTGCGNHPQVCVDWCDAYAYCAGVGKRLCGRIGGGTNLHADYANASLSQWYNACTAHNPTVSIYPYGATYNAEACNGFDHSGTNNMPVAVGTLTGCQSLVTGYAGVYDLSGNIWEWEDSCSGTGQSTFCRLRGGSFYSGNGNLACATGNASGVFISADSDFGLRCCSP